LRKKI